MKELYIGELAKLAGTNPKTIRYYEDLGLLSEPGRTASGYRVYSHAHLDRLRFVQGAKALGLNLADIKQVVNIWSGGLTPCAHVSQLLEDKLASLDRRIAELTAFRDELRAYKQRVDAMDADPEVPCKHIEGVVQGNWAPPVM